MKRTRCDARALIEGIVLKKQPIYYGEQDKCSTDDQQKREYDKADGRFGFPISENFHGSPKKAVKNFIHFVTSSTRTTDANGKKNAHDIYHCNKPDPGRISLEL
jgi:hypothetical protein